jgi:release factor glutamine methyltransferase
VRLVHVPGVFRPISDSRLLGARVRACARDLRVLDVCTGSGIVAVSAALAGADVTAVDVSRRAVLAAKLNARLNGVRVRALRGDLLAPVRDERFDLIASNPPYVPDDDARPARGVERAWKAGLDGRAVLDRLCDEAPALLAPGGSLLLVQSSVCGERATIERLERNGLRAEVVERRRGPLGPLLLARAPLLEAHGLLEPGAREEDVIVVRAA